METSQFKRIEDWLRQDLLCDISSQIQTQQFQNRLYIILNVDPLLLLERDDNLGNWLLSHFYEKSQAVVRDVVAAIIKEDWPKIGQLFSETEQLNVCLRLSTIPYSREHHVDIPSVYKCDFYSIRNDQSFPLYSFWGTAVLIQSPESVIRTRIIECKICLKEKVVWGERYSNRSALVHIIRAIDTIKLCDHAPEEDAKRRIYTERQEIILYQGSQKKGCPRQCIRVVLTDELVETVTLGETVHIIGLPKIGFEGDVRGLSTRAEVQIAPVPGCRIPTKVYVEAVNVLEANTWFKVGVPELDPFFGPLESPHVCPWQQVDRLCDEFGCSIVPRGMYYNIKLSLLLSIVASGVVRGAQDDGNINLFLLNDADVLVRRLIDYASKFYDRNVTHVVGNVAPKVTYSSKGRSWTVEAGCLFSARGGVCVIAEASHLKKKDLLFLSEGEGSRDVSKLKPSALEKPWVQIADRRGGMTMKVPTDASIICLSTAKSNHPSLSGASGLPSQFIEAFDVTLRTSPREEGGEVMEQLLSPPQPTVKEESLFQFFECARRLPRPHFTSDASHLIQSYWIGVRRVRERMGRKSGALTVLTLYKMAEAHGRLCLRDRVIVEDAVVAITLMEESAVANGYPSVLDWLPPLLDSVKCMQVRLLIDRLSQGQG
ncbi:hypothetical protein PROFUN_01352 [Planoprotostelium fungivorum]|uniref:MCM domain-containing protein n=1 Tax=Planoprotostelium fungivorum TaxID=1890364 RepID=A0A2P6NZZ6_9EUKA|nr:hypothetical protein PROFUN_01352 [Planoprotostelium fungivorum]